MEKFDILIIGSGVSGLISAISAAKLGLKVLIVSKADFTESSSLYSQGGIAVALDPDDSTEEHIADTIKVGKEFCDKKTVEFYIKNIKKHILTLCDWGIPFVGYKDGVFDINELAKEAVHSKRRILKVGDDLCGRSLMKTLLDLACKEKNINIAQGINLIELLVNFEGECIGALFQDLSENLFEVYANNTILATGGYSKVYERSSNPETSVGDGIACAYRIGAEIRNMRFEQFHPTALQHPKYFLLSESLRGEGALLFNNHGERFMEKYAPEEMELAQRAVVSKAVWLEENLTAGVFLDISHLKKDFIEKKFSGIRRECLKYGFDLAEQKIPITTIAHYSIGGIKTNLKSMTSIPKLYAIGECANTGLHGSDRLASNSLLECIVSAFSAIDNIKNDDSKIKDFNKIESNYIKTLDINENYNQYEINDLMSELKNKMWKYCSFERNERELKEFFEELTKLEEKFLKASIKYNNLKNMILIDKLIVLSILSQF